ncbi:hypothetical protein SAMN02927937_00539 [Paenimyroides aquimaris]|uniref:Uncharacterized protein n=1 Tax=Paenimyroides marinum TaxID=1159016 RepID=A0A1H6JQK9_9FLAO|nr:hypothetical protein [Paenimyroides aquimaris]SEH62143.1 hypothetical protein SAMN02927937_00539 [Paenimyroides aquimaris]
MKLEVTKYTHFKRLWLLSFYFILFLGFLYFSYDVKYMAIICLLMLSFFTIPIIYIHSNYYRYVKNQIVFLEDDAIKIQLIDSGSVSIIPLESIKIVNLHMSGTKIAKMGSKNFMFEDYFYFEIISIDDKRFIINSLYNNDIDDIFKKKYPSIKIEIINIYYPLII